MSSGWKRKIIITHIQHMLIYVPPGGGEGLLSAHLAAAAVPPGQSWCSSSPQFLQRERDVDSEFVVVFFSLSLFL